ncbi:DUF4361 domain-containing protein [Fulvivirgaceae bacterium PWU5]|uniref:DUF4361 domain-containing protein n=1 Tax=Dawidia cretensis TaxID=2782350 RepID=A0AAP2E0V5_9BACT|nr:DUF4361 domain-containing protein [Dawidia cretensis]MBT1710941.1 DUF4361 domain-containing protein [Dawidia cretensis]
MKIFKYFLLSGLAAMAFACEDNEDQITTNAIEGGLLVPQSASISYVLGKTASIDVVLTVRQGIGVEKVQVYKSYCSECGLESTAKHSNEVLVTELEVNSSNVEERVDVTLNQTYAQLRNGLLLENQPLPEDEATLRIGDFWEYRFVSVMADGREVVNLNTITVSVANAYSGSYKSVGKFVHPTGGERGINRNKTLAPIDPETVSTEYADLGGSGWVMWLVVNPDNTVTLVPKGPASTGTVQFQVDADDNTYNPDTKVFKLRYKYAGDGGDRVVNEILTKQ